MPSTHHLVLALFGEIVEIEALGLAFFVVRNYKIRNRLGLNRASLSVA